MKIKKIYLIGFLSFSILGCNYNTIDLNQTVNRKTVATNVDGSQISLPITTLLSQLSSPESVSLLNGHVFISNVGGPPNKSMGLGFIKEGNQLFIDNLDDPKGMAFLNNDRYMLLSDHPNVKLIDLNTRQVVQSLAIPNAAFLNDAVALSQNVALISDTGSGNVYKITLSGNQLSQELFIPANQLGGNGVNGLAFDPSSNALYIATSKFGGNNLQGHIWEARLDNQLMLTANPVQWSNVIIGNGLLDGIVINNNQLFLSDWEDKVLASSVFVFNRLTQSLVYSIQGGFSSPADISFDGLNNLLYIPEFSKNQVSVIDMQGIIN